MIFHHSLNIQNFDYIIFWFNAKLIYNKRQSQNSQSVKKNIKKFIIYNKHSVKSGKANFDTFIFMKLRNIT